MTRILGPSGLQPRNCDEISGKIGEQEQQRHKGKEQMGMLKCPYAVWMLSIEDAG